MTGRRVVITGVGVVSPIGNSLEQMQKSITTGRTGVRLMPQWAQIADLRTRLAAPVADVDFSDYPRKQTRTMGRVALLSMVATDHAIQDAGLDTSAVTSGRTGLAYGSTHGSSSAMETFTSILATTNSLRGLAGSAYLKFMSHTCAGNLAQCFGIRGRVIPTVAACASASQGIGCGYETVASGLQDIMICGGAEEMHPVHAAVFDIMFAASTRYHDNPSASPRPFDVARDGLVVGEGAGTLIVEELEHAKRRGAKIYAEIVGYGTNCDGTHITAPSIEGMSGAMQLALRSAGIQPQQLDYINAHGTATELGDICETQATMRVVGDGVAFGSTKGYTGHTLGACGAIELGICLNAFTYDFLPPSFNLDQVDPRCAPVDYIRAQGRNTSPSFIMSNNFAFGGINTSIILKRYNDA